jgi:hypothetical protein
MIRGYLGLPGAGKTFSMVNDAWQLFRKNPQQVYTNMAGLRFPEAIYVDGLDGLLHVDNGLVLFDEAGVSLSSRYWQTVSRDLLMRFAQVRKNGLDLWWTSQHENRVDTVLREISNEYVRCQRVGRLLSKTTWLPEDKKAHVSRSVAPMPKTVYALYDTLEVIASHGGSAGRGAASRLSAVAHRRARGEHVRRQLEAKKQRIPHSTLIFGTGRPYLTTPTKAATDAFLYLLDRDSWNSDALPYEQVQRELLRRRWLARFNLGPDDAPLDCTPESPWLVGSDPYTIQEQRRLRELEDAEIVVKTASRRKKDA